MSRPFPSPLLPSSLCCAALLLALCLVRCPAAGAPAGDAFAQNRALGRGVNVLGYDPIWKSFAGARFKEEDFGVIRAGGFDSLRVNLYPFAHMGPAREYRLDDSWWRTAD